MFRELATTFYMVYERNMCIYYPELGFIMRLVPQIFYRFIENFQDSLIERHADVIVMYTTSLLRMSEPLKLCT